MRRKLATLAAAGVLAGIGAPAGAAGTQTVDCGGLQDAIAAAGDGDVVTLQEGATCGGISLTLPSHPPGYSVTVEGAGSGAILDGAGAGGRIATGDDVGAITLRNLTLRNGAAPAGEGGGALRIAGESAVTLDHDAFLGNSAPGQDGGGALIQPSSAARVVVVASTFGDSDPAHANDAGSGGGLAVESAGGAGSVVISGSSFSGNSAEALGGGRCWWGPPEHR